MSEPNCTTAGLARSSEDSAVVVPVAAYVWAMSADSPDAPILRVDTVTKTYGEGHTAVTAVHEASMDVRQGEFVSLLGPSGSGKTTLISMIGGLLTPTSGDIQLGDMVVSDLDSKELTSFRADNVGFVFQSANLVPFLTARENLLWVARLRKERGRAGRRAAALLVQQLTGGVHAITGTASLIARR